MRREWAFVKTYLDGVFDFDGGFGRLDSLEHLTSKLFGVQSHCVDFRSGFRIVILEDREVWLQVEMINNKLEAYR